MVKKFSDFGLLCAKSFGMGGTDAKDVLQTEIFTSYSWYNAWHYPESLYVRFLRCATISAEPKDRRHQYEISALKWKPLSALPGQKHICPKLFRSSQPCSTSANTTESFNLCINLTCSTRHIKTFNRSKTSSPSSNKLIECFSKSG